MDRELFPFHCLFVPILWYKLILVSFVQRILIQSWTGVLKKKKNFWRSLIWSFGSWATPAAFPSLCLCIDTYKALLDIRLWQRHSCLLKCVFTRWCERVLFCHRYYFVFIHFGCHLLSSRPFGFLATVLFWPLVTFFMSLMGLFSFFSAYWWIPLIALTTLGTLIELPNANSTHWSKFRPFICLICHGITREQATPGHETACHNFSNYLWAPENGQCVEITYWLCYRCKIIKNRLIALYYNTGDYWNIVGFHAHRPLTL